MFDEVLNNRQKYHSKTLSHVLAKPFYMEELRITKPKKSSYTVLECLIVVMVCKANLKNNTHGI